MRVASWRLIASPRPVPPKRRVVEPSSCTKASKIAAWFSGRMPVPVSITSMTSDHVRLGRIHAAGAHQHVAAGGELERVRHQVHEDLANAQLVAPGPAMQIRVDVEQQLDALLVRALREQVDDLLDHLADVEILGLEAQLAGLDLREVENVVDDGQQRVGRALDGRREAALARIELGIEQQLGHAEHAVHRRADLVRHAREEFALGAARGLGDAAGLDAVVHRLAQRAVGVRRDCACARRPAPRATPAAARAPARGSRSCSSITLKPRISEPISSSAGDLRTARIVAALRGLHGVHQIQQRRGDLPLHAPRQQIGEGERHHRAAEQDGELHQQSLPAIRRDWRARTGGR